MNDANAHGGFGWIDNGPGTTPYACRGLSVSSQAAQKVAERLLYRSEFNDTKASDLRELCVQIADSVLGVESGHKVFVSAAGEWVRLEAVTDTPEPTRLAFMLSGEEACEIAQSLLDAAGYEDAPPAYSDGGSAYDNVGFHL